MNKSPVLPKLRKANLVVRELSGETLIYNLETHRTFCLNETALLILDQCDGTTTIDQAVAALRGEANSQLTAELIWTTIQECRELLDDIVETPMGHISRRRLLQTATALGIALPIVSSLVAPTAAYAQSCAGDQQPCNINSPNCCSGAVCVETDGRLAVCVGCTPLGAPCTFGQTICCQGFCCDDPFVAGTAFTCNNNCIG
jgi:hypothetical protein